MSDVYVPLGTGSSFGPTTELTRLQQIATNTSIIRSANPWMAQDPEALFRVATSGADPSTMANNAAAMAGVQSIDTMADVLGGLTPIAQRSVYGRLTEEQQRALNQLQYRPPEADGGSIIGQTLGALGPVVDAAFSPVKTVVGAPLGKALDLLTWIGDVPAHFYRAIRQMDGWQQWLALGAGLAAATAFGVATGGTGFAALPGLVGLMGGVGTVGTVAALGGAGLAGATLATAPTLMSNPTEWWDLMNPFGTTGVGRGERIFTKQAQSQSRALLGNANHIDALARDIAANTDAYELAADFAGVRDATSVNVMMSSLQRVAEQIADPGTPEFERVYAGLNVLMQQPEFREAVDVLQASKSSFGRDVASTFGLQSGDKFHGLVSGFADAFWLVALDPTMAVGKVTRLANMTRRGFTAETSPAAVAQISKMVATDRNVAATAAAIGRSIRTESFTELPKAWRGAHNGLTEWRRQFTLLEELPASDTEIFMRYMADGGGVQQLMAGKGTVYGQELIRLATGAPTAGWGRFVDNLKNFRNGMVDQAFYKDLKSLADDMGEGQELERMLAINRMDEMFTSTQWNRLSLEEIDEAAGLAERAGRKVGSFLVAVPGGQTIPRFINNVTTMVPGGSNIALTDMVKAGDNASQNATVDIPRFIDTMGSHFNIPSGVRRDWLDTVMRQGTTAQRRQVLESFMDSVFEVTGMKSTPEGLDLLNKYMRKTRHAYGYGGLDNLRIDQIDRIAGHLPVHHSSVFMVMPDLEEMTNVIRRGHVIKHVARFTDSNLVEASMSRYIKPGWLLRIGFIPRAGGEELLAFIARMTSGGLLQEFGGRSLAMAKQSRRARLKLLAAGGDRMALEPEELLALKWSTPSHMRPLEILGERGGWLNESQNFLDEYGTWLRTILDKGVGSDLFKRLPGLTDNLLLGKQHSLRRMIVNGVAPDIKLAADSWVTRHEHAVLAAASAKNASLADPAIVTPDTVMMPEHDDAGNLREVEVVISGERTIVGAHDDKRFRAGVYSQATEALMDDVVGPIFTDNISRFVSPTYDITPDLMGQVLAPVENIKSHLGRRIALEVLSPREEDALALAQMMSAELPDVATTISRSVVNGKLDLVELKSQVAMSLLYPTLEGPKPKLERMMLQGLKEDLDSIFQLTNGVEGYSPSTTEFLNMAITKQITSEGRAYDMDALGAMLRGEANNQPSLVLYRGISDMGTTKVMPNGDLHLMLGTTQEFESGAVRSTSFTTSIDEAGIYASQNAPGNPSGTIIEFDGDWMLNHFNTTADEMSRNPLSGSSFGPDRGDGPYFFSDAPAGRENFSEIRVMKADDGSGYPVLVVPKGHWRAQRSDELEKLFEPPRIPGELPFEGAFGDLPPYFARNPESFNEAVNTAQMMLDDLAKDLASPDREVLLDHYRMMFAGGETDESMSLFRSLDEAETELYFPEQADDGFDELDEFGEFIDEVDELDDGDLLEEAVDDDRAFIVDDLRAGISEEPVFWELGNQTTSRNGVMFDAYLARQLGLNVTSNQSIDMAVGSAFGPLDEFERMIEVAALRGQGAIDLAGTQQWAPIITDWDTMVERYTNEVTAALLDPANTQYLRNSDRMLQMPDGTPIAQPPAEGLSAVYTPTVPTDTEKLRAVLASAAAAPDDQNHASIVLISLLEQKVLSGNNQAIQDTALALADVIPDQARVWAEDLARAAQEAVDTGTLDAERVTNALDRIRATTKIDDNYERMARRLIDRATPSQTDVTAVRNLTDDQKIRILAEVLEHIDTSQAKYLQPVSVPIESLAYDNPHVARWITNMLDDGKGEKLPSSVGEIIVPRNAVAGKGDFTRGITRRRDGNSVSWTLDERWLNQSRVLDAGNIRVHGDYYEIGASKYEGARAWAENIVEQTLNKSRRGVRNSQRVRDDITQTIGRRAGREYEAIEPGSQLSQREEIFFLDEQGGVLDAVDPGDSSIFQAEVSAGRDELMMHILGPAMRDTMEAQAGYAKRIPKNLVGKKHRIGEEYDVAQEVRMTRSRLSDVGNEQASDLPTQVIAQNYRAVKRNMWDRLVQYGFNNVIGPSLDAIVRKPMSFHYYVQAHAEHRRKLGWLLDQNLFEKRIPRQLSDAMDYFEGSTEFGPEIQAAARRALDALGESLPPDPERAAQHLLELAESQGDLQVMLGDAKAGIIRKLLPDMKVPASVPEADVAYRRVEMAERAAEAEMADLALLRRTLNKNYTLGNFTPLGVANETRGQRFVNVYMTNIPDEFWANRVTLGGYIRDNKLNLYKDFTDDQFQLLNRARKNLRDGLERADESAAMRAIDNVVPFLDSHEERSMFAEYGRNFLPFWYAEENFIKRWSRTLATSDLVGLDMVRKGQLTYMGLRSAGVVRTDESGNDWIIYPGSGLLTSVASKIWPNAGIEDMNVAFQTNTESMLPGVNSEFGGASVSPFLAIPVGMVTAMYPDAKPLQRAVVGDIGASREWHSQFVPSSIGRAWELFFADEDSSTRYASAMSAAIAYSEAHGQGLPDEATPFQAEEFMDRIRNHARIILFSQMIGGYIAPGPPSALGTNQDASVWERLSGVGLEDPSKAVSDLYRQYVQNLGIEEGTAAFLESYPLADMEDVVNPLAFTTSKSESPSRAPLPATANGLAWYNEHRDWIDSTPEAGAWFVPQDEESEDFDYYAYSQQLSSGLRKQRSPQEFLRAVKMRGGAAVYFEVREQYEEQVQLAGNDQRRKNDVDAIWETWSTQFMAANPLFADELQSGESRARRARTRDQLRYAAFDPDAPPSPYTPAIQELVQSYDAFSAELKQLAQRRDATSQEQKRQLKSAFAAYVDAWSLRNRDLQRLWSTVYEPDAQLT